jgi:hypothetical protein
MIKSENELLQEYFDRLMPDLKGEVTYDNYSLKINKRLTVRELHIIYKKCYTLLGDSWERAERNMGDRLSADISGDYKLELIQDRVNTVRDVLLVIDKSK